MPKLHTLRPAPTPLAGPRATLEQAISAAATVSRGREEAQQSVVRLRQMVADASTKLAAATAAVAAAKEAQTGLLTAAAEAGTPPVADRTLRDARTHETDCQDDLDMARTALERAEAAAPGIEHEEQRAQDRVKAAANAVLTENVMSMLDQARAAQEDLIRRRISLRYLVGKLPRHSPEWEAVRGFLNKHTLPAGEGQVEFAQWDKHPANDPWRSVHDALLKDAAAELPPY